MCGISEFLKALLSSRNNLHSLSASEIRQLLGRHWTPPGVKLPGDSIDSVAAASIIRITGGNFRLLNRPLTQVERILEINALPLVIKEVVCGGARESCHRASLETLRYANRASLEAAAARVFHKVLVHSSETGLKFCHLAKDILVVHMNLRGCLRRLVCRFRVENGVPAD